MYCGKCGRAVPKASIRCLQCGEALPLNLENKQEEPPVKYWSAAQALDDCARQEKVSLILFKLYRIYFAAMLVSLFFPTAAENVDAFVASISQTTLQMLVVLVFVSVVCSAVACVMMWRASEYACWALLAYAVCDLLMLVFMPRMTAEALFLNIVTIAIDVYMCYYLYVRKPVFRRFTEAWRKQKR